MILEHAVLPVRAGREADFEAAFARARPLIACQPGFIDLALHRSAETPNEYLLLVSWESVEAHTEGFRRSAEYEQWRHLLHDFYDPFPVVEHFTEIPLGAPEAQRTE
ncbi:antibiotic biosynthesis monooxygenase family protein [Microbacterium sp. bgisy189]|uniref:antibiotic biosynthesis monooxygenase family protein n=1 Tax=Microbacterium sp. bgisy189 TaxID=3413798 RepID=UPI003EB899E6